MAKPGAARGRSGPPDAAVRADVVASAGLTMLVEAAAGTGKTTLLVDRILQGVRDGAVRLAGAVAITFTEKAAGELESRIRAALAEGLHEAGLQPVERRRIRAALGEIDRAGISTIHAFCARLLREKPAEAGVDPEFAVIEPAAAEVLRERCWREWVDAQVADRAAPLVEALRADVPVARLKSLALGLLDAPEVLDGYGFVLPRPERDVGELTAALVAAAPAARDVFVRHMRKRSNDHSRALQSVAGELTRGDPLDEAAVRRLAYRAACVSVQEALKSLTREAREEAEAVLCDFQAPAAALGSHLAADVLAWLAGFARHYRQAKHVRAVLDFQDLLVASARVLRRDVAVRRYFRRRFGAFFVDEFQDTDPLQAEVIAFLCEDPQAPPAERMEDVRLADGKLFAVGDPKQSIYRFRRADVRIYERFKRLFGAATFGEGRTRQVSCNFRATPPLLAWCNRVFEKLFVPPPGEGVYQAAHVPLEAPPDAEASPGPPVLALCPPECMRDAGMKAGPARRCEAAFLARTVRAAVDGELQALGGGEFRYGDFAVLLRALTDVDVYAAALDAQAIPYRVVGGPHFYQREHVAETLTLLEAIDDPLNEAAVVGALRGSFLGLSDEDLLRHRDSGGVWNYQVAAQGIPPVRQALARLAGWHGRRNRVPPARLLRDVFAATRAPHAFRLKPAGQQRVADLDLLLGRLRELGASTQNFGTVVRHLAALRDAQLGEQESALAVEPGDDCVCLMSMHKAKGLEFNVVVLADLARRFHGPSEVGPLIVDRLRGRIGFRLRPGLQSVRYDELADQEYGNQMAEARRLLYVACTRARRLLVLPLYWQADDARGSLQQVMAGTGLFAGAAEVPFGQEQGGAFYLDTNAWADGLEPAPVPRAQADAAEQETASLLQERIRWQEEHAELARRASAAEPLVAPSATEPDREPSYLADETAGGVGGRDFGSLFHNVMMRLPLRRAGAEGLGPLLRGLAAVEADALGLGDGAAAEAARLAEAALGHGEFRQLLDSAAELAAEVAFAVPLARLPICGDDAPGLLEGSIDLLLSGPAGTVVLDYKTDRFRPDERRAVAERYWPQLALYALAARACGRAEGETELALFFVRTGAIVRRRLDEALLDAVAGRLAGMLGGGRLD